MPELELDLEDDIKEDQTSTLNRLLRQNQSQKNDEKNVNLKKIIRDGIRKRNLINQAKKVKS